MHSIGEILYLDVDVGICIEDLVISHLLWTNDLIISASGVASLQEQLDGDSQCNQINKQSVWQLGIYPFCCKIHQTVRRRYHQWKVCLLICPGPQYSFLPAQTNQLSG